MLEAHASPTAVETQEKDGQTRTGVLDGFDPVSAALTSPGNHGCSSGDNAAETVASDAAAATADGAGTVVETIVSGIGSILDGI